MARLGNPTVSRAAPTRTLAALAAALIISAQAAAGASPVDGFALTDAALAERYRALISELRCPKCLNESLASSGAPIAADLRRTVRRLIADGADDAAIRAHLQARYGDFILYDPPVKPGTWALWFAPLALALLAAAALRWAGGRGRAPPLSGAERAAVERFVTRQRE